MNKFNTCNFKYATDSNLMWLFQFSPEEPLWLFLFRPTEHTQYFINTYWFLVTRNENGSSHGRIMKREKMGPKAEIPGQGQGPPRPLKSELFRSSVEITFNRFVLIKSNSHACISFTKIA
jgi:hypothetical protein